MKTIGLIGGMSWESTTEYYKFINRGVKDALGGFHSARCLLYSVDFAEFESRMKTDDWEQIGNMLAEAARTLEKGGADFVVLCTNTMHKMMPVIESAISIPALHIVDPTAEAIRAAGLRRVGLMGTRFTMEQPFYRERLAEKYGLEAIIPEEDQRDAIHRIIFDELCLGTILPESRRRYRQIVQSLVARGAQGIILGCTEIGMLIKQEDASVPLFDTTVLHAQAAVRLALEA